MLRCEGGCRRPDGFPLRDAVTRLPHRAYDGRAGLVAREHGRDFGSFVPVAVRAHTHNVPLFRSMAADNNLRGVAFLFQSLDEFFGIALIQERSNLNGQLHASGPGDLYWRVGRSWISRCRGRRGGGWCGLAASGAAFGSGLAGAGAAAGVAATAGPGAAADAGGGVPAAALPAGTAFSAAVADAFTGETCPRLSAMRVRSDPQFTPARNPAAKTRTISSKVLALKVMVVLRSSEKS